MINFSAEVQGVTVFERAFNRVTEHIEDFTEDWPAVLDWFHDVESELFITTGRSGGQPWAPLSPRYEEQKAKTHPFSPPMRRSDAMYLALTRPGVAHSVYRPEPQGVTMGVDLPYPAYHMTPAKNRPARPVIQIGPAQRLSLQKVIQRRLLNYVRAQGFRQQEIGEV